MVMTVPSHDSVTNKVIPSLSSIRSKSVSARVLSALVSFDSRTSINSGFHVTCSEPCWRLSSSVSAIKNGYFVVIFLNRTLFRILLASVSTTSPLASVCAWSLNVFGWIPILPKQGIIYEKTLNVKVLGMAISSFWLR